MKEIQQAIMDCILMEIEKGQKKNISSTQVMIQQQEVFPCGVTKDIIEKHKRVNPWLKQL
jgi:hypothetical protein